MLPLSPCTRTTHKKQKDTVETLMGRGAGRTERTVYRAVLCVPTNHLSAVRSLSIHITPQLTTTPPTAAATRHVLMSRIHKTFFVDKMVRSTLEITANLNVDQKKISLLCCLPLQVIKVLHFKTRKKEKWPELL